MSEIAAIHLKLYPDDANLISVTQPQALRGTESIVLSAIKPTESPTAERKDRVQLSESAKQQNEKTTSLTGQEELSEQEKLKVSQLKETDRKVRAHEQAHILAGGDLIRGRAQFTYDVGPDKKRYAVAGEVSIDTSPEDEPEATLRKADRIKKAALAPADPSPQDRAVAAEADRMAVQARMELARMQKEQSSPASGKLVNLTV